MQPRLSVVLVLLKHAGQLRVVGWGRALTSDNGCQNCGYCFQDDAGPAARRASSGPILPLHVGRTTRINRELRRLRRLRQLHPLVRPPLRTPQELLLRQTDVLGDLAQQRRRDVPAGVKGDGRTTAVSMPILLVRTPLPNLCEAQPLDKRNTSRGLSVGRLPTTQP